MLELQLKLNAARAANNLAASNEISRAHGIMQTNKINQNDTFNTPISLISTKKQIGPSSDDHLKDSQIRSYIKEVKKIPHSQKEYQITIEDKNGNTKQIHYNGTDYANEKQIEKIQSNLIRTIEKNKARNERAADYDISGKTAIDFINDKNRRFNRKLARAFDEYTEETRLNIERGGVQ